MIDGILSYQAMFYWVILIGLLCEDRLKFFSLIYGRYANRAKNIKNKAKINEDPKDALLREFQKEIEKLRAQLEEGKLG